MGGNLARRLMRGGHQVVAWDHGLEAIEAVAADGTIAVASIEDMAGQLTEPRTFCVMLPAGEPTEQTVTSRR